MDFTTPHTYTVWLRGYPTNAAGDSVYVGLEDEQIEVTGFTPGDWSWANTTTGGVTATLSITTTGVHTVSVAMREDGLRIDRLLLTTDTTYIPADAGPAETDRQLGTSELVTPLTRTIVYTYDNLYRLTEADYTTGELYAYSYDSVGNRLQQIIDGDTTTYQYDAANRLEQVTGSGQSPVSYTFDDNGNLLQTGVMTNSWDAANRLIATTRDEATIEPIYNGVNDRVAQTVGLTTTYYALDVRGLPEVIYTSEGNAYLHLPGVIMTESSTGQVRYLLSDGLGSVRQAVDETGAVVAYNEFDPYGNPVQNGSEPYGYTGEWWQDEVGLLHLRARWYLPETGTFLSVDPVESEPPYQYVWGNPISYTDPTGLKPPPCTGDPTQICVTQPTGPGTNESNPSSPPPPPPPPKATIGPMPQMCYATDFFEASGYVEGYTTILSLGLFVADIEGKEVVYDFATLERATYEFEDAPLADPNNVPYVPGGTTPEWGITNMTYYVDLNHFDSWKNLDQEYSGDFYGISGGVGFSKSVFKELNVSGSVGAISVFSPEVSGSGGYVATGSGASLLPISFSFSKTNYWVTKEVYRYVPKGLDAREEHIKQMKDDIQNGVDSPTGTARPYSRSVAINQLDDVWRAHETYFMFRYHLYQ